MDRTVITDAHAPNPIGSYNQAVITNGFVFTAGQIAIDPDTGKLIEGSLKDRVEQVFKNLSAILERAGTDLSKMKKLLYGTSSHHMVAIHSISTSVSAGTPLTDTRDLAGAFASSSHKLNTSFTSP